MTALTTEQVLRLQAELNKREFKGYNGKPLKEDGIFGLNTSTAVIAFKRSVGLSPNDNVGPVTWAKLTGDTSGIKTAILHEPGADPPWYKEALAMIGKHEKKHNRELSLWLKSDGSTVGDPAEVPWCADFVQTALLRVYPEMDMPDNPFLSANWDRWGTAVPPQRGSILRFWRESPTSWKGHLAFYAGESKNNYYALGANQNDQVSIVPISKRRLVSSRWPVGPKVPKPTGRRVQMSGGVISTNEA
jgi:uncharacterized protein (TIGR02594 family)